MPCCGCCCGGDSAAQMRRRTTETCGGRTFVHLECRVGVRGGWLWCWRWLVECVCSQLAWRVCSRRTDMWPQRWPAELRLMH
jgi:hypothetical protein